MTVRFDGVDELNNMLHDIGSLENGNVTDKMLKKGQKVVEKKWNEEIKVKNHIHTGLMMKKVKSTKIKANKYGKFLSTFPQGEDTTYVNKKGETKKRKKPIRNAEKAFYLHYGWFMHGGMHLIKGDHFVDKIETGSIDETSEEMAKVLDDFLRNKGAM